MINASTYPSEGCKLRCEVAAHDTSARSTPISVDAMLAGEFGGGYAGIVLLENADDLRFGETTLSHRKRLLAGLFGSAVYIFRGRELSGSGKSGNIHGATSEPAIIHSTFFATVEL